MALLHQTSYSQQQAQQANFRTSCPAELGGLDSATFTNPPVLVHRKRMVLRTGAAPLEQNMPKANSVSVLREHRQRLVVRASDSQAA